MDSQITLRKRKKSAEIDCTCTENVKEIWSEMFHIGSVLEKHVGTNEKMIQKMQDSIDKKKKTNN